MMAKRVPDTMATSAAPASRWSTACAPPATRGNIVVAIRRHSMPDLRLTDYVAAGAFARGALTAARWLQGKRGWFTMHDVLGVP